MFGCGEDLDSWGEITFYSHPETSASWRFNNSIKSLTLYDERYPKYIHVRNLSRLVISMTF